MITDSVLQELWQIKDSIAKEHGYDLARLVDYLRLKDENDIEKQQPIGELHHVQT